MQRLLETIKKVTEDRGRDFLSAREQNAEVSLSSFCLFNFFRMFFFELTVRSHDPVVGMGFSDHGDTENADFMITWVDSNGKRHVQVCFANILLSI